MKIHRLPLPLLLLTALSARAATPISPEQQSTFLKPYLNDATFMVLHIDTALPDTAALEKFAQAIAPAFKDPAVPDQITALRHLTDVFLARFHALGGRHIYLLSYSDPAKEGEPQPPIILLPLDSPPADPEHSPLMTFLSTIPNLPPAVKISDSLYAIDLAKPDPAKPSLAQKLNALIPSPRPDIDRALAASTGSAQIVLAPGNALRKILGDNLPTFPPEFGGGSTDVITKHFQYFLISLNTPPNASITFTLQSDSPENAAATRDFINAGFKSNAEHDFTHTDLALTFPLTIQDNAATITLDQPKLEAAFTTLIPPFILDRQHSKQIISSVHIRQLISASLMYANQNNQAWPPTLHTLLDPQKKPDQRSRKNPNDPQHRPYEYHYWSPEDLKKIGLDLASTPVLWELIDDDSAPRNVGFLDGHVEPIKNKADLTTLLDAAKEKAKAP